MRKGKNSEKCFEKPERKILFEIYLLDADSYTFLAEGDPFVMAHMQSLSADDQVHNCFATVGKWEYGTITH